MYGIQLNAIQGTQDFQQEFYGLNRNLRRSAGEFYNMKNMTTDYYPVLSTRKKRGVIDLRNFLITSTNNLQAVKECFDGSLAFIQKGENSLSDTLYIKSEGTIQSTHSLTSKYDKRKLLYLGGKLVVFPDMLQVEKIYNKKYNSKGITAQAYSADGKYYIKFGFIGVDIKKFRAGQEIKVTLSEIYDTNEPTKVKAYHYLEELFSTNQSFSRVLIEDKNNNKLIVEITAKKDLVPTGYTDTLFDYFSSPLLYNSTGENELRIIDSYTYDYLKKSISPYGFELKICDNDGKSLSLACQKENPADTSTYWYDTDNKTLKEYSSSMQTWVAVTSLFIKMIFYDENSASIKTPFEIGDSVGFNIAKNTNITTSLKTDEDIKQFINDIFYIEKSQNRFYSVKNIEKTAEIYTVFSADISLIEKYIALIFSGTIKSDNSEIFKAMTIMPELDYICEGQNRLWGCRYGTDYKGDFVNEIYCSELGNFANWYNYEGASTDSFAVSLGEDGDFRGCVFLNGRPSFFKENAIFTVYGEYPANFQLVTLNAKGVQKGSENSIALCSDGVLYKGADGVYLFDGSSVQLTSQVFGVDKFYNANGAMYGLKYYVSMQDKNGKYFMYVLDLSNGFWVKEDENRIDLFFNYQSMLFFVNGNEIYSVDEEKTTALHSIEDDFEWNCETGTLGYSQMENKYIGRFNVRLKLADKTRVNLLIAYDNSDNWENQGTMKGTGLQSFDVPVIPHRCDHFNIKIKGKGSAKIFSIGKMIYSGGNNI